MCRQIVVLAGPLTAQAGIRAANVSEIHIDISKSISQQSHRTSEARECQHRDRVGPGYKNRWHSLASGILTVYTETYEDDRLSIQNSPHSEYPVLPAAQSVPANKCNQNGGWTAGTDCITSLKLYTKWSDT